MNRISNAMLAAAILAAVCWPGAACSQDGPPPPRPKFRGGRDAGGNGPQRGPEGMAGQRRPPYPPHFDQLAKLPLDERRKAQEADPRFQRMTPEQQERARQHLEEFVNLSEEQKAAIREQWAAMRARPTDRPNDGRGRGPGEPRPQGGPGRPGMGPGGGRGMGPGGDPGPGGMGGSRRPPFPPFFEQLAKLAPDERRKALEGESRFQKMPADQQEKIRQSLDNFANMSEEEKARIRERWTIMNNRSPEERQRIREGFQHWNQIPAERRAVVREELRVLRGLPPAERDKRIASPEFQRNFSPAEQHLLRDMTGIR